MRAPGETLRAWLDENDLTPEEAARACRCMRLERFQGVLDGTVEITAPIAGALQAGTGLAGQVLAEPRGRVPAAAGAGGMSAIERHEGASTDGRSRESKDGGGCGRMP